VERFCRLISELRRTLSLTELILDCLPVYRPQMILAPAILVKQIYKRLPCRLQFADLRWCFLQPRELLKIARDLAFHPAEIVYRLAFARIEGLDHLQPLLPPPFVLKVARATLDDPAVEI